MEVIEKKFKSHAVVNKKCSCGDKECFYAVAKQDVEDFSMPDFQSADPQTVAFIEEA